MANNRMWLVHNKTGNKVLLAKHFGTEWRPWDWENLAAWFEGEWLESEKRTDYSLEFEVEE